MVKFSSTLCFGLTVFAVCSPTQAQDASVTDRALAFSLNNVIYTLYHELGHMFVGELDIPVLAKEEDAADNFAAVTLLSAETVEADQALIDSSDGWFLLDEANTSEFFEEADFYDSHSLDLQRAYSAVCLMVGADPDVFSEVAESAGIDEDRQLSCADDFAQTANSWNRVLTPLLLEDGGVPAEIEVIYEDTEDYRPFRELIEDAAIFEDLAVPLMEQYAFPRGVTLRAAECDESNAYYDPEVGEVVMCYELAAELYDLYVNTYDETN